MVQKISEFNIIKTIQENGEKANVYLVEDNNFKKYIVKEFSKSVQPFVGYSKYNHYGRRREGSKIVFDEISEISKKHFFLIRFYKRFRFNNRWCILMEYVEGETLGDFIREHHKDKKKIINIIEIFALEIKNWHNRGFAHGDPHLENVIVENQTSIRLIDYSQLHHKSFSCCIKFKCFENSSNRFKEDLVNKSGKLGAGFITEIENIEKQFNFKQILSDTFKKIYYS